MQDLLKQAMRQIWNPNIVFAGQLWEKLKSHHLHDIADIVIKEHTKSDYMLEFEPFEPREFEKVPMQIVRELTKNCKTVPHRENAKKERMLSWMRFIMARVGDRQCIFTDASQNLRNLILNQLQNEKNFTLRDAVTLIGGML
jgi:hypothetical protein